MGSPVLLRPANMHLLIPELGQQQPPTGIYKTAGVALRLVVAAQGSIDGTARRAGQRDIRRYEGVAGTAGGGGGGGVVRRRVEEGWRVRQA